MADEYHIVERVIRNISHEIKNPLTTMKGYAQLLSSVVRDDPAAEKSQRMVLEQIERIDNTFNKLYSLFSIGVHDKEDVDISEIVEKAVNNLPENTGNRVKYNHVHDPAIIACDRNSFKRLLQCFLEGFDWLNNTGVELDIVLQTNGSQELVFSFKNIDFSSIMEKIFYLPFSSTQYFKEGTELYEVYCIAYSHGWDFRANVYPPESVFTITF